MFKFLQQLFNQLFKKNNSINTSPYVEFDEEEYFECCHPLAIDYYSQDWGCKD